MLNLAVYLKNILTMKSLSFVWLSLYYRIYPPWVARWCCVGAVIGIAVGSFIFGAVLSAIICVVVYSRWYVKRGPLTSRTSSVQIHDFSLRGAYGHRIWSEKVTQWSLYGQNPAPARRIWEFVLRSQLKPFVNKKLTRRWDSERELFLRRHL